uniref:MACPF domain-containing protein n=1 Tax=Branchiostoma floridae TaxID=7739 RepID=C3Z339_BRAFL|eukprot:XP_002597066.1 hypothetical protein BRAFLDRAFT_65208 [Branchiostoma floridae]
MAHTKASKKVQPCNTFTCPVDCQVGDFGDWSVCDPCLHTQPLVETRGCSPDRTCPLTSGCTSGQFKCVTTGRCVPASFRCNGDDDCCDQSDEQECLDVQNLCEGKTVEGLIPNIDIAGSGYNVLTEELSGQVLDNSKYGGQCRIVYSGDHGKTFRLPHNTQFYRFQVVADTSFRAEQFSSSKQFYQDTSAKRQRDIHTDASTSFSVFTASAEVVSSQSHGNHDVLKSSQDSDSALLTVSNQIELAQFRINGGSNFILALEELPVVYSYAEYKKLIVDFGTHYVSAGKLGGQYRYAYRYNRRNLTESGLSDEQQKSCLSNEAKASFLGISIGGGFKKCQNNKLSQQTAVRALVQYLDEFHPCKCAPCRNNGKAVLIGTACECVCAEGTYGASCEKVADPSLAGTTLFPDAPPTPVPRTGDKVSAGQVGEPGNTASQGLGLAIGLSVAVVICLAVAAALAYKYRRHGRPHSQSETRPMVAQHL